MTDGGWYRNAVLDPVEPEDVSDDIAKALLDLFLPVPATGDQEKDANGED